MMDDLRKRGWRLLALAVVLIGVTPLVLGDLGIAHSMVLCIGEDGHLETEAALGGASRSISLIPKIRP